LERDAHGLARLGKSQVLKVRIFRNIQTIV
jgi:hypothetical protein